MKIKMTSLFITDYCSTDKRKLRFIKEISEDPLINHFVSPKTQENLEESEGINELVIGPAYIIEDQRKLVGIIRLAFVEEDGTLNLHYAVHPDYRRMQYGTKILNETSKYILKKMPNITKIELYIKENNKASINCAKKAKFIYQRDIQLRKGDSCIKIYSLNK